MKRHLSTLCVSAALLGLLSASPVLAGPILASTATLQSDGTYLYGYSVENPSAGLENLHDFGLFFVGDSMDITTPAYWDVISGLGFINWFSLNPDYDITVGSSLGGFSFVSALAPGDISFTILGDPVSGPVYDAEGLPLPTIYEGTTTGPVSAVPEPGSLLLLSTGGLVAWVARKRRSHLAS